jgi:hypothetical protein
MLQREFAHLAGPRATAIGIRSEMLGCLPAYHFVCQPHMDKMFGTLTIVDS